MTALENIWIIPALTFASFWIILLVGKRLPYKGAEIGIAAIAAAFAFSLVAAGAWIGIEPEAVHEEGTELEAGGAEAESLGASVVLATEEGEAGGEEEAHEVRPAVERGTDWFTFGQDNDRSIRVGTTADGLALMMLVVVTTISLLVQIFSTNYMHGDVRYTHFFAMLSLFTTGMLVLVTASTTLQMLVGWEIMGLTSFGLIGHWWEKKPNSDAALKAFLTTRTGDIGLLVGIITTFFAAGQTFDIDAINLAALNAGQPGGMGETALLLGAIALFIAVIGKSAQFPLHTWLPDAMAGPTPVSALIHAATMVVAGVYLVARLYGVFWEAFDIEAGGVNVVAAIGGVTILIAALLAFVQSDIKKVLAYSTISQLGYMVMALGVGAWTAAIFHLFTHAFFKGLLFLGSGSVSHAVHSFDMKAEMGGLRKHMPITFVTFIIGSVALAGVPPLAGFWSKDEILLGASENGYPIFLYVGLLGAFMTAAYMTRCVYLTFFGEYRGHGHPHESPLPITGPLVVLAVASVVAGFANAPFVDYFFAEVTLNETVVLAGVEEHEFSNGGAALSTGIVLASAVIAGLLFFGRRLPVGLTQRNGALRAGYRFLENKYYLDHLYTGVVIGSIKGGIARAAYWFNQVVLDGIVNGVGNGARSLGRFVYRRIDQGLVDGAVNGSGVASGGAGGLLRLVQNGRVSTYGSLLFGATAFLAVGLILYNS